MNGKRLAGIMTVIAGMVLSVHAQNYNASEDAQQTPPDQDGWHHWDHEHLYHDTELSVDMFGVGILHSYDFNNGVRARHDLRFGAGAGVNVFFTRYIGVGGDFTAISFRHSFVDTTTANLIVRFPIRGTGLAPYIFGGAGYQFQGIDQIIGGGGAGLELRLVPHFSIFVDGRYMAAVKTPDFGIGRAGVRLSF